MNPLVVIPARGGSKGLSGKNIKLLNGKPLIHYAIDVARSLFKDELICVSTDSLKIKEVAEETGIKLPFKRPAPLALDTANSRDVLLHALDYYKDKGYNADTVIILQPTSPLRTKRHMQEALELYTSDIDMVVSVFETDANPYYILKEENEQGFLEPSKKGEFTRRQEAPVVYQLNGAVYVINVSQLRQSAMNRFTKVKKYLMPKADSVDIDGEIDFQLAALLLRLRNSL